MNGQQFEMQLGKKLRDHGIESVIDHNLKWVDRIRKIARYISNTKGSVSADDLRRYAKRNNDHPGHVNCWGGIFRGKGWVCIDRKQSDIASNHAREIKVWRYIQ